MANIAVAFNLMETYEKAPNDYDYIGFHLVWDLNIDFTRKSRLVAEGHKTPDLVISN